MLIRRTGPRWTAFELEHDDDSRSPAFAGRYENFRRCARRRVLMTQCLATLAMVTTLFSARPLLGQERQENSAYEHLKQLQPLIGTWESERARITCDWDLGKRFIRYRVQVRGEGETTFGIPIYAAVFGWDRNENTLTITGFRGWDGTQLMRRIKSDGHNKWSTGDSIARVGLQPDGGHGTVSWSFDRDGALVVSIKDREGNTIQGYPRKYRLADKSSADEKRGARGEAERLLRIATALRDQVRTFDL